jgi:hypothetical protein
MRTNVSSLETVRSAQWNHAQHQNRSGEDQQSHQEYGPFLLDTVGVHRAYPILLPSR